MKLREGDQALPVPNDAEDVQSIVLHEMQHWRLPGRDLLMVDILARRQVGVERYGTALQPHNGRDALRDLYEELLDGVFYARQAAEESKPDGKAYGYMMHMYEDLLGRAGTVRTIMEERDG